MRSKFLTSLDVAFCHIWLGKLNIVADLLAKQGIDRDAINPDWTGCLNQVQSEPVPASSG